MKNQTKLQNLTVKDIQGILSAQMRGLSDNTIAVNAATAMANVAGKMFTSIKLQMEFAKMTGQPIDGEPFALPAANTKQLAK